MLLFDAFPVRQADSGASRFDDGQGRTRGDGAQSTGRRLAGEDRQLHRGRQVRMVMWLIALGSGTSGRIRLGAPAKTAYVMQRTVDARRAG